MKNILTLFSLIFLLFVANTASAVNATNTVTTNETTVLSKKEQKMQKRMEKRMAKLEKKMAAQDIDFRGDEDMWKNLWLLGWGGALVLFLLGGLLNVGGIGLAGLIIGLGGLAWFLGTVCLIVWLVKKFG